MPDIENYIIDPNGTPPEIEVFFGQAHWGNYQIFLYDENGKNPAPVLDGVNTDNIPDKTAVGNPADLNKKMLYWHLRTARASTGSGDRYFMKVIVKQDGGSEYEIKYEGDFDSQVIDAIGIIRFVHS